MNDLAAAEVAVDGIDLVFHLAAMISVPESMDAPRECAEIYVMDLPNVLEAAAANGVKKFMLANSVVICSDNLTVPKTESMTPEPKSAYSAVALIFLQKTSTNEDLTISDDSEQASDFIHVKDIVAALVYAAVRPDLHSTYTNVGYGSSITVNDLTAQIIHLSERSGDVKRTRVYIDKLRVTGFEHVSSLEEGLAETFTSFRIR